MAKLTNTPPIRRSLRGLILVFALFLGIGQMWGATKVISYEDETKDAETTISTSNQSSGTAGEVSWNASSATWNSNSNKLRWEWAANSTITFSVGSDYVITRVIITTTSTKQEISVTPSTSTITGNTASPCTISDIDASSVTISIPNAGAYYIKNGNVEVYYTEVSSGSDPSLTLNPSSLNLEATGNSGQTIALTTNNFSSTVNSVECEFFSAAGCAAGDAVSQPAWITNLEDNNSNQVTFNVADNDGTVRNVWMKITAGDGTKSASAILPISQKAYVVDFATLPFEFTGGRDDIANTSGMTQNGLGTDYTSGNPTTKLKFDNTGDWLIIKINAAPGTLSYDIKGNSFSGSTFTVQQSADGETYTAITDATYTSMGDTENESKTLAQTTRYVKFIYTNKSSGNVGLGNIGITAYVAPAAVSTPVISGTESFVTSTEVSITCATAESTIYYTTDGTDPKTSGTKQTYSDAFTVNADGATTVRAIANKGSDWSAVATKTFTKITPLTVAGAIALIPNQDDTEDDQYVAGIVCTAGTSVNASGQMTYYISDDGSETSRLKIYKGKNVGNTNFSEITDLAIGDRVVVFGQLLNYNGTYEMNEGNYLVEKADPAVATPLFTPNGGGFMGETDVTIECATGSSTIYYTLDGSTPSKLSTPYTAAIHLTETKTITAIAYVGEEHSVVVAKTFTYTSPMTVADALDALDSEDPINNAAVTGIISTAPTSNPSSGKLTYYISDDGTKTNELQVYLGFGLNGASFSNKTDLQVGDEVTVFGNLTIHNYTTKEFASGNRLLTFNRPTVEVTGVTLDATASVQVGKTITLTAEVAPSNATNKTIVWTVESGSDYASVDENGVVTGVAEGTAVIRATSDEDANIYDECTVTVAVAVTFNNSAYEWQPATSLEAGQYYILAHASKSAVAGNTLSSGYLNKVAASFSDGVIAYNAFATDKTADEADVAVFQLGGTTDAWTLTEVLGSETGVLGGAGTTSFTWGTGTTTWPITFDEGNAVIGNASAERVLYNSGSPRFKPYGSGTSLSSSMLLPQLYVWTLKTNKLRYDANGGENAPDAQAANNEGKATVTEDKPTKDGKIFDHWNTLATDDGENKVAGNVIDLSAGDVTLYAQWRDPNTYNISYNANGGTLISGKTPIDPEEVTEGTQYTVKTNVYEKEGKVFTGWQYGVNTYNSGDKLYPTEDIEFVAQWSDPNISDFILVTDVNQLQAGDKVYIVAAGYNKAMSTQYGTTYRNELDIAKTTDKSRVIIATSEPVEFTLGKDGNKYTFSDATGYLYAAGTATSSKNYLNTKEDYDTACDWYITIDENGTEIKSVENDKTPYMQYNSSNHRFSCYNTASQLAIVLYKKANNVRELTAGRYGTICLPKAGLMFGASIFEIAYFSESENKIFMDEVMSGEMVAGRPYIFLPNEGASKLAVIYTSDAAVAAGYYHGLYGFYDNTGDAMQLDPGDGHYILFNNQFREVTGGYVHVDQNRAYFKIGVTGGIPTSPSAPLPGRRRVAMSGYSTNAATGMENAEAVDAPQKMMINGTMYILRGEKLYDATGRLVK